MTPTLDVVATRAAILDHLQGTMGLKTRDVTLSEFSADGPNLTDRTVRFKVGTSHGEVSVSIYQGRTPVRVLRVLRAEQIPATLRQLTDFGGMQP